MHSVPPSILPFSYKYPSSFQHFVDLNSAVPLSSFATPTTHASYCESLAAAGVAAAAAAANRVAAATHLAQHPMPQRTTQLRKSFTIEAILGLDSTKNGQMCNRVPNRDFCYAPVKENDIRRRNRSTPYNFSTLVPGNKQVTPVITDKETKTHFEESFNSSKATKSKRVRTIFTPEQLERLESEFERQQYMVGPERLYLASALNLTEAQVKVWFQNRRIKWRKQHLEMQQARLAKLRNQVDGQRFNEVESSSEDENE